MLLAITALSGASCDAVLGIQRFGEPGGGTDDATTDGAVAVESGGDAGGRDAADAGRDAQEDSSAEDQAAAEAGDAGMDASGCTHVVTPTPPAHGLSACPSDGSACFPTDETTFTPIWVPPPAGTPHKNACTKKQVDDSFTSCYGTGATTAGCKAWSDAKTNSGCAACIFSDLGASHYGAVIVESNASGTDQFTYLNVGGCVALAEPCNLPCAKAILDDYLCAFAACSVADGGICASASEAELSACLGASDMTPDCSCGGYLADNTCINALGEDPADHPAWSLCALGETDFGTRYETIGAFMCGP